jgi:TRAP-type C4-dicarboxylate transport system permease small subunit
VAADRAAVDRPGAWRRVYDGLAHLGGVLLALMTAAVFVQVVARYIFARAIDGIDEVPRYLFVWLVMIGAAAAMQRGEHSAVDFFRERMGPVGGRLVLILTNAAGVALFLTLIRASLVLVPNAQLQTSAGLGLPLGYVFAAVPVGSALMILPMLRTIALTVRELWQRRS